MADELLAVVWELVNRPDIDDNAYIVESLKTFFLEVGYEYPGVR